MRRRAFVKGVLAGGAGVVSTSAAAAADTALGLVDTQCQEDTARVLDNIAARPAAHPESPTCENLWPLLGPLHAGDSVGLGWRVTELSVVTGGAAVLTLASANGDARLHICRREAITHGLAQSEHLDLVLMNRGDGQVKTDESLARVVNVLAELIRRNEQRGVTLPEGLLSHESRLLFYGSSSELL
jgi:hypothetical protein